MKPSEYKARYENLKINLGEGRSTTVAINKYRLGQPTDGGSNRTALMNKVGTELKDFQLLVGDDLAPVDPDVIKKPAFRTVLASPYTGKGAPEHCQCVLQLAHHLGLTTDVQKYADENLGLDCNGFVGNFLWHAWKGNPWTNPGRNDADHDGPDMRLDGFFDVRRKNRIKQWSEINTNLLHLFIRTKESGEIIVSSSGNPIGHIVISEPGQTISAGADGHFGVRVVESTASHVPPGLSENSYAWLDERKAGTTQAIFKVDRGADISGPNKQIWFLAVRVDPVT